MNKEVEERIKGLKSLIELPNIDKVQTSSYAINEKRTIYAIDVEESEGD